MWPWSLYFLRSCIYQLIASSVAPFCLRDMEAIDRAFAAGVGRVILGTAAVSDERLLAGAVQKYGEKIAVGADLRDGRVAIRGWREDSGLTAEDFLRRIEALGVRTVICTDISRDGAMRGANAELYERLQRDFGLELIASGGVSSLEDWFRSFIYVFIIQITDQF